MGYTSKIEEEESEFLDEDIKAFDEFTEVEAWTA